MWLLFVAWQAGPPVSSLCDRTTAMPLPGLRLVSLALALHPTAAQNTTVDLGNATTTSTTEVTTTTTAFPGYAARCYCPGEELLQRRLNFTLAMVRLRHQEDYEEHKININVYFYKKKKIKFYEITGD